MAETLEDVLFAVILLLLLSRVLGLLVRRFGIANLVGNVAAGLILGPLLIAFADPLGLNWGIRPAEPTFHYNLACSQSLLGEVSEALESLRRAIDLGYRNLEYMQTDADLENVRRDERYRLVVRRLVRQLKGQREEV